MVVEDETSFGTVTGTSTMANEQSRLRIVVLYLKFYYLLALIATILQSTISLAHLRQA